MDKKAEERAVLRMVYDEQAFARVDKSERPDFLLQYPSVPTPFGVEITQLYFTEADARLRNVPGYMQQLWAGGDYRHKDDKKVFRATKMQVIRDGVVRATDVPGIFRELPPVAVYARQIAASIMEKSAEASGYQSGLSHVNLIVIDRENRLRELHREHLFRHIFIPEVNEAVARTLFREIFLITGVRDGSQVVIPMRQALLMAEYWLFADVVRARLPELEVESDREVLEWFAAYLRLKGIPATINDATEDPAEVFLGNSGLCISGEETAAIHDHADYPLPCGTERTPDEVRLGKFLDDDFMKFAAEYSSTHDLVAPITYDARKP